MTGVGYGSRETESEDNLAGMYRIEERGAGYRTQPPWVDESTPFDLYVWVSVPTS